MSEPKRQRRDNDEESANGGIDGEQQQNELEAAAADGDGNDDGADRHFAADANVDDNPVAAKAVNVRLEKLERIQLHFSKIAPQFFFKSNAASYMDWTVQFEAELSSHELDHVIFDDPELAEEQWSEDSHDLRIAKQEQKTVYNMIVRCLDTPEKRNIVITAMSHHERTGFHAWRALRRQFIGDERTYLLGLESQYESFRWEASENWAAMETRFDAMLAQLAVANVHKKTHQRIARIMSAIEQSNRRDAQNASVYTRLHTTNRIKDHLEYSQWMTAMRTEAQMIQDELAKRGAKRPREESEHDRESVSFVGQPQRDEPAAASSSPSSFPPRFNGPPELCRNMQNRGYCKYGKECRFSHNIPAGGRNGSFNSNFSSNRSQGGNNSFNQGGMNNNRNNYRNSNFNGQGGRSQGETKDEALPLTVAR